MRQFSLALIGATLIAGCASKVPDRPTASVVGDADFAYLLTHVDIVSESPLPHLLPPGSKYSYRILGVTQQGNCVNGCPPSTLYVASSNYYDSQDGHISLCRVDGLRFYSRVHIKEYKPTEVSGGDFLVFEVRSNPEPRKWLLYEIGVKPSSCSIKLVREYRDGT